MLRDGKTKARQQVDDEYISDNFNAINLLAIGYFGRPFILVETVKINNLKEQYVKLCVFLQKNSAKSC